MGLFVVPIAAAGPAGAASGGSTAAYKRAAARRGHAARWVNPFALRGMWIWVVGDSNGGNIGSIIGMAHQYKIRTLIIKSGDGSSYWSQFTSGLVSTLHNNGLKVCAWQYLYGAHPITEAQVGAEAVRDGADCLVLDAEIEYEDQPNNYVHAQTYFAELRSLIGANFPVALAGFPYVYDHPGFPYSVFLGPGGAQYNTPQMYWHDIGDSVDTTYANTYAYNKLYGRPIYPLGQVYNDPPTYQIFRFRQLSRAYGAANVSWWDWQEAAPSDWVAVSRPAGSIAGYARSPAVAVLGMGSKGDIVVWAQERLVSAGYRTIGVDGIFGPKTRAAVESFERRHRQTVDGVIGPEVWGALLRYPPVRIHWAADVAGHTTSAAAGTLTLPVPASSRLPAKRDELAGAGGAGWPTRR
jgi:Putative peptidoglycan binding domain